MNVHTDDWQTDLAVAMDASGDPVVAWESGAQDGDGFGVYAQRYFGSGAPEGAEFLVNTHTTNDQTHSATAMDADGNFVAVWESDGQDGDAEGVYFQRFGIGGTAAGSETRVNVYTAGEQGRPAVAMDADGDFIVAWQSFGQDGDQMGIYARRFVADGTGLFGVTQVNSYTTGGQLEPAAAMDADGNFVIVWEGTGPTTLGSRDVFGRLFSFGGSSGPQFRANIDTPGIQTDAATAMDPDGDFVIAWSSSIGDGDGYGIYAHLYSASGTAAPTEIAVNTYTTGDQIEPSVAMDRDGNFVVAWGSYGQDGSDSGVYARRFHADGTALGTEVPVNTYTTDSQEQPSIAMDADGSFVVAWESIGQNGGNTGIYGQRFDGAVNRIGSEFRINTQPNPSHPSATMDSDGDFIVLWTTLFGAGDPSSRGVFGQSYVGGGCYGEPVWLNATEILTAEWLDCVSYSRIDAGPDVTVNAGGTLVLTSPSIAIAPGFGVAAGGTLKAGP